MIEATEESASRRIIKMTDFRFVTRTHVRSKVKPTGTGGAKVSVPPEWLKKGEEVTVKLILEPGVPND